MRGTRSFKKTAGMLAVAGAFAISTAAGAAMVAAPAFASTCLPLGSTCAPDDFTGDGPGTLLASQSGSFSFAGAFSGTYASAVFDNSGTLDFDFQAAVNSGSANGLTQLSVSDFEGVAADMGYRTDGGGLTGTTFVDQIPDSR